MLVNLEIDSIIYLIGKLPTSAQRVNARNKIKEMTSKSIDAEINANKELLRNLRSESEGAKRTIYSEISKLEMQKDKILSGQCGL